VHTLKSACLVVVLLGVLYGVYVALNKPDLLNPTTSPAEGPAPLIEYGTAQTSPTGYAAPQATSFSGSGGNAPSLEPVVERSPRGGAFQPNLDTGSMPPPTSPASGATPSGLQRSAYEAPIASPTGETSPAVSSAVATEPTSASLANIAPVSSPSPALAAYDLKRDMAEVEQLVQAGKFKAALATLTPHYADTGLPEEERRTLLSWLDALAAKVIYSREHLLLPAHQIRKGEDLYQIAHQYNVEFGLLQNINHQDVNDPLILVPGTELKVIPGPFHAAVNLTAGELTVYVGDLYAGRFAFTLGDQPPQPGAYKVVDKRMQQKTYVGFDGRVIPANDPANPYGGWWISLGAEVAIHGSPLTPAPKTLGCISLSPQDAKDIFSILSLGSEVKIDP
jgi:lipoprotein-anchoring transpeptidase ErfK/SrfK